MSSTKFNSYNQIQVLVINFYISRFFDFRSLSVFWLLSKITLTMHPSGHQYNNNSHILPRLNAELSHGQRASLRGGYHANDEYLRDGSRANDEYLRGSYHVNGQYPKYGMAHVIGYWLSMPSRFLKTLAHTVQKLRCLQLLCPHQLILIHKTPSTGTLLLIYLFPCSPVFVCQDLSIIVFPLLEKLFHPH